MTSPIFFLVTFLVVVVLLGIFYYSKMGYDSRTRCLRVYDRGIGYFFVIFFLILLIGFRPIDVFFPDMQTYAWMYESPESDSETEIFFSGLMKLCRAIHIPTQGWFVVVSAFYFASFAKACKLLSRKHREVLFVTFLLSFSTFNYATNVIRAGMASSLLMLGFGINLMQPHRRFLSFIIMLCAFFTHFSVALPIGVFFLSKKINLKTALYVWLIALFISLAVGESITTIFNRLTSLTSDARMERYTTGKIGYEYNTGFRWDFLLYSLVPIAIGYYLVLKRKIQNIIYCRLLVTYILSNAFWIIVIRAHFSDRFAYLSWFLYPIVIAYPIVELYSSNKIQIRNGKLILFMLMLFTLTMSIIR